MTFGGRHVHLERGWNGRVSSCHMSPSASLQGEGGLEARGLPFTHKNQGFHPLVQNNRREPETPRGRGGHRGLFLGYDVDPLLKKEELTMGTQGFSKKYPRKSGY